MPVQLGDYNLALETFKKTIKNGPDRFTAYLQLAGLLRYRLSCAKEADRLMDQLVEANPKSATRHLLRGNYQLTIAAEDSVDKAAAEAAKAIQLAPDDADALALAAQCAMIKRPPDLNKGRGYIKHGVALYPGNFTMHGNLADIELIAGHRDQAIAVLQQGLKATNRHPDLLWKLVNLSIDGRDLKGARQIVEELRAIGSSPPILENLQRSASTTRCWSTTWPPGSSSRKGTGWPPVKASRRFATRWSRRRIWRNRSIFGLRRATTSPAISTRNCWPCSSVRWTPHTPWRDAQLKLLLRTGKIDQIKHDLPKLSGGSDPSVIVPLILALIAEGVRQEASEQNWRPVEKALEQAEKVLPGSAEVVQLRVQMLVARNCAAEAESLLRTACGKDPKQGALWASLVALMERRGDWGEVEKLLGESQKALGDSVMQRIIQANYLALRYGKEAKDRLRKLGENSEKFSEAESVQLWAGLLDPTAQAGERAANRTLLPEARREAARQRPSSVHAVPAGADGQRSSGHAAGARRYSARRRRERLLAVGPGDFARYAIQQAEESGGGVGAGVEVSDQGAQLNGDWPPVPLAMARIYDQQGDSKLALTNYLEALKLGDRAPGTIRRAILILYQTQQYNEADEQLRWLEKQHVPFSRDLIQICAEVALQRQDYDRALTMARKIIAGDSKDYQEQISAGPNSEHHREPHQDGRTRQGGGPTVRRRREGACVAPCNWNPS